MILGNSMFHLLKAGLLLRNFCKVTIIWEKEMIGFPLYGSLIRVPERQPGLKVNI